MADAQRLKIASESRLPYIDLVQNLKETVQMFGAWLERESVENFWQIYVPKRNKVDHEREKVSDSERTDLIMFALSVADDLHVHEAAFQQIREFFKFPNVVHPDWHTEFWARRHGYPGLPQALVHDLVEMAGHPQTDAETDLEIDEAIVGHLESRVQAKPDWTPELSSWPDVLAGPWGIGMGPSEIALAADVVTLPGDAARRRDVWAECVLALPAFYICCRREYAYEVLASTESLPNISVLVFYDSYGGNFADPYSARQLSDLRRLHDGLAKLEDERDDSRRLGLARQLVESSSPDLIFGSLSLYPVRPENEPFPVALEDYLWSLGESLLDWYFMNQNAEYGEPGWGDLKQSDELASALDGLIRREVLASPGELQALGVCAPRG